MSSDLPLCKYGSECYRKNTQHLLQFSHSPPPAKKRKIQETNKPTARVIPTTNAKATVIPTATDSVKVNGSAQPVNASSNGDTDVDIMRVVATSTDHAQDIKQKFLVSMPQDFYQLWKFCQEIKPEKPECGLCDVGLWLVGAYDVLSGRLQGSESTLADYLTHWRFYYDPPELQTVVYGGCGFHLGYWRDSPGDDPVFVGSNTVTRGCRVDKAGCNIFAAINGWLLDELTSVDPFKKMKYKQLQEKLVCWCTAEGISLDVRNAAMKKRTSRTVCKSFHTAGIVVPYNKKTQLGYRELPETDGDLKKILVRIVSSSSDDERRGVFSELSEIMTNVDFANDEGDPGMGLELGIDLFCYGSKYLHKACLHLLTSAYNLLHREQFTHIINSHLENRRSGDAVSIIPHDDRVKAT